MRLHNTITCLHMAKLDSFDRIMESIDARLRSHRAQLQSIRSWVEQEQHDVTTHARRTTTVKAEPPPGAVDLKLDDSALLADLVFEDEQAESSLTAAAPAISESSPSAKASTAGHGSTVIELAQATTALEEAKVVC